MLTCIDAFRRKGHTHQTYCRDSREVLPMSLRGAMDVTSHMNTMKHKWATVFGSRRSANLILMTSHPLAGLDTINLALNSGGPIRTRKLSKLSANVPHCSFASLAIHPLRAGIGGLSGLLYPKATQDES
jgi:hypothetical protein